MPTQTFFSLPEDKRNRILKIATQEFSRLRFDEVSINEIIKQAHISRGSFYQYFADKDDLFLYLGKGIREELMQKWRETLTAAQGNLFQSFDHFTDKLINYPVSAGERILFLNMLMFMSEAHALMWQPKKDQSAAFQKKSHHMRDFGLEQIQTADLRVSNQQELIYLLQIMSHLLMQIVRSKLLDPDHFSKESEKRRVQLLLEWLEHGVKKEENFD